MSVQWGYGFGYGQPRALVAEAVKPPSEPTAPAVVQAETFGLPIVPEAPQPQRRGRKRRR